VTRLVIIVLAALLATGTAHGQPFPSKPLRIIVPFPPGGAAHLIGQVLADHLKKSFPQGAVIDPRVGAGGIVGYEATKRAPADGHTIALVFPSIVIHPWLRKVEYHPLKDFKAVAQIASLPIAIAVHPSVPVKSFQELTAFARARPDEIAYGTSGVGTLQHILGEMIVLRSNVKLLHIPYSPPRVPTVDVAGGHIPMVIANIVEIVPFVDSRKVRAIAVSTPSRAEPLSHVPTFRESGFPQLETTNWSGIVVPTAAPDVVIARLNSEIVRALSIPDVQQVFKTQGMSPAPSTPEEFANLLKSESERYGKVIRAAAIKVE
jgi:tripartite-type tricarboxylate transporter receptor subunit TctC